MTADGLALHEGPGADVLTLRLGGAGDPKPLRPLLVEQLHGMLDHVVAAAPAVLVLRAAPGPFCAGFYYGDLDRLDRAELSYRFARIALLLDRLYTFPAMTIALVEGAAVGAGADLAIAADVRIGTDQARLRFPGPTFGLALGTARLSALIDPPDMHAALSGYRFDAEASLRAGLLTDLVEPGQLESHLAAVTAGHVRLSADLRRAALALTRPRVGDRVLADLLRSSTDTGLLDRVRAYVGNQIAVTHSATTKGRPSVSRGNEPSSEIKRREST